MSLKSVGMVPLAAVAIMLWDHDAFWLTLVGAAAVLDWFGRWGWASPEITGFEQALVDAHRAKRPSTAGKPRLEAVPSQTQDEEEGEG